MTHVFARLGSTGKQSALFTYIHMKQAVPWEKGPGTLGLRRQNGRDARREALVLPLILVWGIVGGGGGTHVRVHLVATCRGDGCGYARAYLPYRVVGLTPHVVYPAPT
jgi:hypothetical protein